MRLRVGLSLIVVLALVGVAAAAYRWPSYAPSPGPGSFALITIEHPRHGARVRGPDVTIRLRTDNSGAKIRVLLDDKVISQNGDPLPTDSTQQLEFSDQEMAVDIRARRLAPGLHSLRIERGVYGTALPSINLQQIEFVVESI